MASNLNNNNNIINRRNRRKSNKPKTYSNLQSDNDDTFWINVDNEYFSKIDNKISIILNFHIKTAKFIIQEINRLYKYEDNLTESYNEKEYNKNLNGSYSISNNYSKSTFLYILDGLNGWLNPNYNGDILNNNLNDNRSTLFDNIDYMSYSNVFYDPLKHSHKWSGQRLIPPNYKVRKLSCIRLSLSIPPLFEPSDFPVECFYCKNVKELLISLIHGISINKCVNKLTDFNVNKGDFYESNYFGLKSDSIYNTCMLPDIISGPYCEWKNNIDNIKGNGFFGFSEEYNYSNLRNSLLDTSDLFESGNIEEFMKNINNAKIILLNKIQDNDKILKVNSDNIEYLDNGCTLLRDVNISDYNIKVNQDNRNNLCNLSNTENIKLNINDKEFIEENNKINFNDNLVDNNVYEYFKDDIVKNNITEYKDLQKDFNKLLLNRKKINNDLKDLDNIKDNSRIYISGIDDNNNNNIDFVNNKSEPLIMNTSTIIGIGLQGKSDSRYFNNMNKIPVENLKPIADFRSNDDSSSIFSFEKLFNDSFSNSNNDFFSSDMKLYPRFEKTSSESSNLSSICNSNNKYIFSDLYSKDNIIEDKLNYLRYNKIGVTNLKRKDILNMKNIQDNINLDNVRINESYEYFNEKMNYKLQLNQNINKKDSNKFIEDNLFKSECNLEQSSYSSNLYLLNREVIYLRDIINSLIHRLIYILDEKVKLFDCILNRIEKEIKPNLKFWKDKEYDLIKLYKSQEFNNKYSYTLQRQSIDLEVIRLGCLDSQHLPSEWQEIALCSICGNNTDWDEDPIFFCDGCYQPAHHSCVNPRRLIIIDNINDNNGDRNLIEDQWFCDVCINIQEQLGGHIPLASFVIRNIAGPRNLESQNNAIKLINENINWFISQLTHYGVLSLTNRNLHNKDNHDNLIFKYSTGGIHLPWIEYWRIPEYNDIRCNINSELNLISNSNNDVVQIIDKKRGRPRKFSRSVSLNNEKVINNNDNQQYNFIVVLKEQDNKLENSKYKIDKKSSYNYWTPPFNDVPYNLADMSVFIRQILNPIKWYKDIKNYYMINFTPPPEIISFIGDNILFPNLELPDLIRNLLSKNINDIDKLDDLDNEDYRIPSIYLEHNEIIRKLINKNIILPFNNLEFGNNDIKLDKSNIDKIMIDNKITDNIIDSLNISDISSVDGISNLDYISSIINGLKIYVKVPICQLCGLDAYFRSGGIMKKTYNGGWAHIRCGLATNACTNNDGTLLKVKYDNEKVKLKCDICLRYGYSPVKCQQLNCNRYYHLPCVSSNNKFMVDWEDGRPILYCSVHSHDIAPTSLLRKYQIRSLQKDLQTIEKFDGSYDLLDNPLNLPLSVREVLLPDVKDDMNTLNFLIKLVNRTELNTDNNNSNNIQSNNYIINKRYPDNKNPVFQESNIYINNNIPEFILNEIERKGDILNRNNEISNFNNIPSGFINKIKKLDKDTLDIIEDKTIENKIHTESITSFGIANEISISESAIGLMKKNLSNISNFDQISGQKDYAIMKGSTKEYNLNEDQANNMKNILTMDYSTINLNRNNLITKYNQFKGDSIINGISISGIDSLNNNGNLSNSQYNNILNKNNETIILNDLNIKDNQNIHQIITNKLHKNSASSSSLNSKDFINYKYMNKYNLKETTKSKDFDDNLSVIQHKEFKEYHKLSNMSSFYLYMPELVMAESLGSLLARLTPIWSGNESFWQRCLMTSSVTTSLGLFQYSDFESAKQLNNSRILIESTSRLFESLIGRTLYPIEMRLYLCLVKSKLGSGPWISIKDYWKLLQNNHHFLINNINNVPVSIQDLSLTIKGNESYKLDNSLSANLITNLNNVELRNKRKSSQATRFNDNVRYHLKLFWPNIISDCNTNSDMAPLNSINSVSSYYTINWKRCCQLCGTLPVINSNISSSNENNCNISETIQLKSYLKTRLSSLTRSKKNNEQDPSEKSPMVYSTLHHCVVCNAVICTSCNGAYQEVIIDDIKHINRINEVSIDYNIGSETQIGDQLNIQTQVLTLERSSDNLNQTSINNCMITELSTNYKNIEKVSKSIDNIDNKLVLSSINDTNLLMNNFISKNGAYMEQNSINNCILYNITANQIPNLPQINPSCSSELHKDNTEIIQLNLNNKKSELPFVYDNEINNHNVYLNNNYSDPKAGKFYNLDKLSYLNKNTINVISDIPLLSDDSSTCQRCKAYHSGKIKIPTQCRCCLCGRFDGILVNRKKGTTIDFGGLRQRRTLLADGTIELDEDFKLQDDIWIHPICAEWTVPIRFILASLDNLANIEKRYFNNSCYYCGYSVGVTIHCANNNCDNTFHVSCGRMVGCRFDSTRSKCRLDAANIYRRVWCLHHIPNKSSGIEVDTNKHLSSKLVNINTQYAENETSVIEDNIEVSELEVFTTNQSNSNLNTMRTLYNTDDYIVGKSDKLKPIGYTNSLDTSGNIDLSNKYNTNIKHPFDRKNINFSIKEDVALPTSVCISNKFDESKVNLIDKFTIYPNNDINSGYNSHKLNNTITSPSFDNNKHRTNSSILENSSSYQNTSTISDMDCDLNNIRLIFSQQHSLLRLSAFTYFGLVPDMENLCNSNLENGNMKSEYINCILAFEIVIRFLNGIGIPKPKQISGSGIKIPRSKSAKFSSIPNNNYLKPTNYFRNINQDHIKQKLSNYSQSLLDNIEGSNTQYLNSKPKYSINSSKDDNFLTKAVNYADHNNHDNLEIPGYLSNSSDESYNYTNIGPNCKSLNNHLVGSNNLNPDLECSDTLNQSDIITLSSCRDNYNIPASTNVNVNSFSNQDFINNSRQANSSTLFKETNSSVKITEDVSHKRDKINKGNQETWINKSGESSIYNGELKASIENIVKDCIPKFTYVNKNILIDNDDIELQNQISDSKSTSKLEAEGNTCMDNIKLTNSSNNSHLTEEKESQDQNSVDYICEPCGRAYLPFYSEDDDFMNWICCDSCENWYHWVCVGINDINIPKEREPFYCMKCLKKGIIDSRKEIFKLSSRSKDNSRNTNKKINLKRSSDIASNTINNNKLNNIGQNLSEYEDKLYINDHISKKNKFEVLSFENMKLIPMDSSQANSFNTPNSYETIKRIKKVKKTSIKNQKDKFDISDEKLYIKFNNTNKKNNNSSHLCRENTQALNITQETTITEEENIEKSDEVSDELINSDLKLGDNGTSQRASNKIIEETNTDEIGDFYSSSANCTPIPEYRESVYSDSIEPKLSNTRYIRRTPRIKEKTSKLGK